MEIQKLWASRGEFCFPSTFNVPLGGILGLREKKLTALWASN